MLTTLPVTVAAGDCINTLDAGFYKFVSVGNYVWYDINADGLQGDLSRPSPAPRSRCRLAILSFEAITDTPGSYLFQGLMPGNYSIRFDYPAGFTAASPANVLDDGAGTPPGVLEMIDSDGVISPPALTPVATFTLSSGVNDDTIDQGFYKLASLGNFVWFDQNADGIQDQNEPGVANASVLLLRDGVLTGDSTVTDADGFYAFNQLQPGFYAVQFVLPSGFDGFTTSKVGTNNEIDSDVDMFGLTAEVPLYPGFDPVVGLSKLTLDAGLIRTLPPGIQIVKDANKPIVGPFGQVTYSYLVTNTGATELTNVVVIDNNGTIGDTQDDFAPTFVGGDSDLDGRLDANENWTYTATKFLPLTMCDNPLGADVVVGSLVTNALANGDVQVTYVQNNVLNDNSYGANIVNWPSSHTFNSLLGSDKAEFSFKNKAGTEVMHFFLDYLTATNTVPSGYKSLGVSGGDGSISVGSAANIASFDTSMSKNFNSAGLGVVAGKASNGVLLTTNSPKTVSSSSYQVVDSFFNSWEFRNIYQVTIKAAAFGTSGFGSVAVPTVHNSPPKAGTNASTPLPCDATITNIASVTAQAGGIQVSDTDDATVTVATGPLGSIGDYVWSDTNRDGIQDSDELGVANVTVQMFGAGINGIFGDVDDRNETTTTDVNGKYSFSSLLPGKYQLMVTAPATFDGLTLANMGTNDLLDSDVDPVTQMTGVIVLASGANNLTVDAGLLPKQLLKIARNMPASRQF